MSDTIKTKICGKCKQEKPISEFHSNKSRKDNHSSYCKSCANQYLRQYMKSEEQKEKKYIQNKKYNNTPKGRENRRKSTKKYHKSEKGKKAVLKYLQSTKGKAKIKENHQKYPLKRKAQTKVANEIRIGRFPKIQTRFCKICKKQAEHYHHPDYSKPLDVIPLCISCHKIIHNNS